MSKKLYSERDIEAQGEHYAKHVMAMTAEDLHSKSDIAAELAHRDIQNAALFAAVAAAFAVLDDVEEINPSNYDHDLVCQLNTGTCEAYAVLESALTEAQDDE